MLRTYVLTCNGRRTILAERYQLPGVRVTQSNDRNLSVSHRDSVAILEALVGPKAETAGSLGLGCGRRDSNPQGLAPTGT
jgi:hypothetical protein